MKIEREIIMKRIYFQPEVTVAQVALNSMILAGSAGGGGSSAPKYDIPTDDQW